MPELPAGPSRGPRLAAAAGRRLGGETPHYSASNHQQYLANNPFGYRCHASTGVKFPVTA